ncbi:hypothetical protein, partial [Streptomyces sp. NPDC017941]|uniref:hypothetical protein n=1 Tax=Streptomyces sp. NPDC017941 TaxID=3365018 RepID=UPI003789C7B6
SRTDTNQSTCIALTFLPCTPHLLLPRGERIHHLGREHRQPNTALPRLLDEHLEHLKHLKHLDPH